MGQKFAVLHVGVLLSHSLLMLCKDVVFAPFFDAREQRELGVPREVHGTDGAVTVFGNDTGCNYLIRIFG